MWGMMGIILMSECKKSKQKQNKSNWLRKFLINLGRATGFGLSSYCG